MTLPADFIFSQNNLQDFVDCPRRFQLKYLEKTVWPAPVSEPIEDNDRLIRLGLKFHQMVHQHYIGISDEEISRFQGDENLKAWWNAFLQNPPKDLPETTRSEMDISMPFENYRLAAKIDLLAVEPGKRAVIVDWKTTQNLPKPSFLIKRIQSQVYPFLVISTGTSLNNNQPFDPSQVTMIYWYPVYPDTPVLLTFDQNWLKETRQTLSRLVHEISTMDREIYPLTIDPRKCQFCRYRSLCERGIKAGNLGDEDNEAEEEASPEINFDDIQEIPF